MKKAILLSILFPFFGFAELAPPVNYAEPNLHLSPEIPSGHVFYPEVTATHIEPPSFWGVWEWSSPPYAPPPQ